VPSGLRCILPDVAAALFVVEGRRLRQYTGCSTRLADALDWSKCPDVLPTLAPRALIVSDPPRRVRLRRVRGRVAQLPPVVQDVQLALKKPIVYFTNPDGAVESRAGSGQVLP